MNNRIKELCSLITRYQKSYYSGNEEISDAEFDALWDELRRIDPTNPVLQKVGSDIVLDDAASGVGKNDGVATVLNSTAGLQLHSTTESGERQAQRATSSVSSPPKYIGSGDPISDFPKVRHLMGMGSQSKCSNEEEFLDWAQDHSYSEYLVEYKLDGASLELQYENGTLTRAITRGDGVIGDDITANARLIKGVIGTLGVNFTGAVRGEVLMERDIREKHFPDTKNCRNAAAGLMKRKDNSTDCRYLTLIVYDALDTTTKNFNSESSNQSVKQENSSPATLILSDTKDTQKNNSAKYFNDEVEKVDFLKKCGFTTSPLAIFTRVTDVIDYRARVDSMRANLNYDIDGLVIKCRTLDIADSFKARPENQVAFKFSLDEATTTLRAVEWNQNGATFTPVAIFDAVTLCGTNVGRASLCNSDTIKALGAYIGCRIVVVKRGEIIPKVERVIQDDDPKSAKGDLQDNNKNAQHTSEQKKEDSKNDYYKEETGDPSYCATQSPLNKIIAPTICPTCSAKLIDSGTRLYCPNSACSARLIHAIHKWVGMTGILELGDVLIKTLVTTGTVKNISDIYTLNEEVLRPYFLQDTSRASLGAKRVITSIQNSRRMTLSTFLSALDIEGIGKLLCEKVVAAGFNTLPKVLSASKSDIAAIMGFADIMAATFVDGLKALNGQISQLSKVLDIIDGATNNGVLRGKSFCFTGSLNTMTRDEAQKRVSALGGTSKTSVTKDLTYLVTNNTQSNSAKNKKAREYGTSIIDESEFIALLGGQRALE